MTISRLIHDMIRICPQSGEVIEYEGGSRSMTVFSQETLQLVSPRNAYVSFQLIVPYTQEVMQAFDIVPGSLVGEQGEIAAGEYALYVQWYHRIQGRYIPDALIPWKAGSTSERPLASVAERNAVPDQNFAALWLDLFIPADTPPGSYTGHLEIVMGTERFERCSVAIQVLEATVPNASIITADLNSYADGLSRRMECLRHNPHRYADGTYFKVERQFYRMAHEHRCLLHYLPYSHSGDMPDSFAPALEGKGKHMRVSDWSRFDEHYGAYLDGSAFQDTKRGSIPLPHLYLPFNFHWPADYAKFGTKGYATEFTAVLDQFHRHFTEMGWLNTKFELFLNHKKRYKLFPYDGDETRFVWDEKINDLYYALGEDVLTRQDGASIIFRTDSSWCFGQHYEQYAAKIHHWVVNETIGSWYPEGFAYLKAQGCEAWTYGSAQEIGQSLLGTAIGPLVAVARGVDGFLYWESLDWGADWQVEPAADGATTMFYPGDGIIGVNGPLPSIRLKALRNAMQTADLTEAWIRVQEPERRAAVSALVAQSLGVKDDAWWPGKPDFIRLPPYEWIDTMFSDAPQAMLHQGKQPESFLDLRHALWRLIEQEAGSCQ